MELCLIVIESHLQVTSAGVSKTDIYLPGDDPWYDVDTFESYLGPKNVAISTPLDKIAALQVWMWVRVWSWMYAMDVCHGCTQLYVYECMCEQNTCLLVGIIKVSDLASGLVR